MREVKFEGHQNPNMESKGASLLVPKGREKIYFRNAFAQAFN